MDVVVSGKANNEVLTSVVPFDVAEAPPGRGSIYIRSGGQEFNFINSSTIAGDDLIYGELRGEKPPNFLYDYDIIVKRFQITVGNFNTRTIQGNNVSIDSSAMADINAAGSGTSIVIRILEAEKIDGDFISPTDVEPFVLTLK